MTHRESARTTTHRIPRVFVVGLLVVIATISAALGYQPLASSSTTAASHIDVLHLGVGGEAGGAIPDGATVSDDELPGVANLDPALLRALRQAATDARGDGIEFYVNSGWRSPTYQEQLLDEAISKYGSREKAARWVGTPTGSSHVSGDAVDIGHYDAMAWLSKHGAKYGLYQIYSNEPWHYELRPGGRPQMYADPSHDPRMRQ